jgi:hypothetical protein
VDHITDASDDSDGGKVGNHAKGTHCRKGEAGHDNCNMELQEAL